jgi:hypothetical protein
MLWMRALVWTPSVTMPACAPVRKRPAPQRVQRDGRQGDGLLLAGGQQHVHLALVGQGMMSLASLMRLSVTPLMAETTTTIRSPLARIFGHAGRDVLDAVGLPTEVPPYFWTINFQVDANSIAVNEQLTHAEFVTKFERKF